MNRKFLLLLPVLFISVTLFAQEDIWIADFEGDSYAPGWVAEGVAFGEGPARGTLPGQMVVSGFEGRGLVNSFTGGDGSVGKLTSPTFKIERPYLNFLIGGGGHAGVAMNLIVEGEIVRTVAGPNTDPGGTEALERSGWDVRDFAGKDAVIEIVDNLSGSWGHINVDSIVMSVKPIPQRLELSRALEVQPGDRFIHLPVTMTAPKVWIRVEVDGKWNQEFDINLTESGEPDFYVNLDCDLWTGKKVTLFAERVLESIQGLDMVRLSDKMSQEDTVYRESLRPQFHFTPRTGWTNDPNGLVWYKDRWHLFFQHNPFGTQWGNMTWGHAASPDLFHWTEYKDAIHPDELGTIFSGSGVVDHRNSSGFKTGDDDPIVLIYTYEGGCARFKHKTTQGIAYSVDGGKNFVKYENNPVLPHLIGGNRDPKVFWHEPSNQWIMALYMDAEDYSLFGSGNLKEWEKLCDIKNLGCSECPDMFELPIDGNNENKKWVFWGGNGNYLLGTFDGKEFKPETKPLLSKYGGNDYAAQSYSDAPAGRRVQLSWMAGGNYPNMPFNQQFTVPRELTLRTTPAGVRLFMEPVRELETLRGEEFSYSNLSLPEGKEITIPCPGSQFDSQWLIELGNSKKITLDAGGCKIVYLPYEGRLMLDDIEAPLNVPDGQLRLRIVVDKTSIELFAQQGEVQIAKCILPSPNVDYNGILFQSESEACLIEGQIWSIESVWK